MYMQELIDTLIKNRKPLLVGLGFLAVGLLFLGNNLLNLWHNKTEKRRLARQSVQLEEEYQELRHTKELLDNHDPVLLEKIARTQYHLAKPGEIEFRFENKPYER